MRRHSAASSIGDSRCCDEDRYRAWRTLRSERWFCLVLSSRCRKKAGWSTAGREKALGNRRQNRLHGRNRNQAQISIRPIVPIGASRPRRSILRWPRATRSMETRWIGCARCWGSTFQRGRAAPRQLTPPFH